MNLYTDVLIVTTTKVESEAVVEVFQGATGHTPKSTQIGEWIYHGEILTMSITSLAGYGDRCHNVPLEEEKGDK